MPPKKKAKKMTDKDYRNDLLDRLATAMAHPIDGVMLCPVAMMRDQSGYAESYNSLVNCYIDYSFKSHVTNAITFTMYNNTGRIVGLKLLNNNVPLVLDDEAEEKADDHRDRVTTDTTSSSDLNPTETVNQAALASESGSNQVDPESEANGDNHQSEDGNGGVIDKSMKNEIFLRNIGSILIRIFQNLRSSVLTRPLREIFLTQDSLEFITDYTYLNKANVKNIIVKDGALLPLFHEAHDVSKYFVMTPISKVTNDSNNFCFENDQIIAIKDPNPSSELVGKAVYRQLTIALSREEAKLHPDGKYHGERAKWADV